MLTAIAAAFLTLALAACAQTAASPTPASPTQSAANATQAAPSATLAVTATATSTATPPPTASATPVPPSATPQPAATATPQAVVFAAIGDYGLAGTPEADVAALVHSWEPDFILTTGDNNYPDGTYETIDENIGQYYAGYIYPYSGEFERTAADETNRFFPTIGNHDYGPDGIDPYLDYFTLPGNERYYDVEWWPLHIFAVNNNWAEPDGVHADSVQGQWLQERLSEATAPWKIVAMHVPPYSSGTHGSNPVSRWPYAEWGASAVLAGHDHHYERLLVDDLAYFVNGVGGYPAIYAFEEIHPASVVRFNDDYGAMRVEATAETITFEFVTRDGELIDRYTLPDDG